MRLTTKLPGMKPGKAEPPASAGAAVVLSIATPARAAINREYGLRARALKPCKRTKLDIFSSRQNLVIDETNAARV
jgi:hypothetical protein